MMNKEKKDLDTELNCQPLVSIITPCYNGEEFISKTIESVLNQSYQNFEMIVIDNASTDESHNIVDRYTKKDGRIKQYKIDINIGGANAWKLGVEKSKGEYVAFLDADDVWHPNKLSHQLQFMIKNKHDFSYTVYHWISEDDVSLNNVIRIKPSLNFKQFISNTCIGCSTVIISKQLINSIVIPVYQKKNWDFATWGLILKKGYTAYGLKEDLMSYRIVSNSASRNKFRYARIVWNIYSDVFGMRIYSKIIPFTKYAINAFERNIFYKFRRKDK